MRRPAFVERVGRHRRHPVVVRAVLPVADLAVAGAFHARLGFEVTTYDDGYAWVNHHGDEVYHLRLVADLDPTANAATAFAFVGDVDAWHRRCIRAGLDPSPVVDEPWGMREFTVVDPSGNHLRLGTNS